METTVTIQKKRTREEILAWLGRARQRKIAWEEKMQKKLEEEASVTFGITVQGLAEGHRWLRP